MSSKPPLAVISLLAPLVSRKGVPPLNAGLLIVPLPMMLPPPSIVVW